MTDDEIKTAIGEADGWERERFISPIDNKSEIELWKRNRGGRLITKAVLPDYPNDLNAIIAVVRLEAERGGFGFQADYQLRLQEVVERRRPNLNRVQIGWWMNVALPVEHCEAFLRTIGKWKE